MTEYNFEEIEGKWQKTWEEKGAFTTSDDSTLPNYYVLVEFPYPSGEGLHIGHPRSYVALDIIARKRRMEGFNVLYPMGWDAFGLPTENYAIRTGMHPRTITDRNIARFKHTMQRLGLSFDWTREIDSTDPSYYKWTQWIFLKMWEHGLAYKTETPVNWCESCKVGLANEEVVDGRCERCDGPVTLRKKEQWMLRITAYAERLLEDLDTVDYLPRIKQQQINWIGRSEGTEIDFPLLVPGEPAIRVFTTRPDTVFGVTYLVLSPEHELLDILLPLCGNQPQVRDYIEEAARKAATEYYRTEKEMTGVNLEGISARNPVNGNDIPVWISDYVLSGYGTGAIMAVPGHDKRDWLFAREYGLPVIEVVSGGGVEKEAFTEIDTGIMVNSGPLDGLAPGDAIRKIVEILEDGGYGKPAVRYKLRDWVFSRQRYWGEPIPMVYCERCGWVPLPESDLPLVLPEIEQYQATATGESPLSEIEEWVNTACPKCHGPARRETDTMPQWAGSSWYFLRYCDPANDTAPADYHKLEEWIPVDWYNGGMEHTTLHLLYSRFWHKFLYDIGMVPSPEPYKKRTSHGMILGENGEKMSKSRGNVINPEEVMDDYGADSLRLFEMFMGDFEKAIPWSTHGLSGMSRFLQRVWNMQEKVGPGTTEADTDRILHQAIKKVSERVETMKFNTALAALMEAVNHLNTLPVIDTGYWELFLKLLSPFAPHICEELWETLGKKDLVCRESWPVFDPQLVTVETVEIPVQVNGKLKCRINAATDADDEQIEEMALDAAKEQLRDRDIQKVIVVRRSGNILVNVVTG
ncbi:MAG: leucine--tRNA ligase [Dehalococcoidales bacterium]|nr:leucine--tRNA ligase [Dehalococcoidales bacterium]